MNLRNSVLFSLPFVFFACGEPDNQPDLTWHGNNELKKAFDAFVDLGKKSGIAIPKEAEDYIKILESALDDKFEDLKVFAPSKNLDLWYFSTILNLSLFLKKMGKICLETVNNAKNQYIEDLKESKKIENEIFLCVREIKNSSFSLKPVCWEDLTLTLEDLGELYRKMKAGELNNSELLQISFLRHKFVFKIIDSQSESFLTIWRSGGLFLSPIFEEDFVSKHQEKK